MSEHIISFHVLYMESLLPLLRNLICRVCCVFHFSLHMGVFSMAIIFILHCVKCRLVFILQFAVPQIATQRPDG